MLREFRGVNGRDAGGLSCTNVWVDFSKLRTLLVPPAFVGGFIGI